MMLRQPYRRRVEKWVAALRSGEYKQGKLELRTVTSTGFRHCCLGVATDLYCKAKRQSWDTVTAGHSELVMPPAVCEWIGMPNDANPNLIVGEDWESAAKLNDNGVSFKRIARAIEKTFLTEE
jgi:hypothetical protein